MPKGRGIKTSSPAHLLGGERSNFLLSFLRRRESDLTQEHRMNWELVNSFSNICNSNLPIRAVETGVSTYTGKTSPLPEAGRPNLSPGRRGKIMVMSGLLDPTWVVIVIPAQAGIRLNLCDHRMSRRRTPDSTEITLIYKAKKGNALTSPFCYLLFIFYYLPNCTRLYPRRLCISGMCRFLPLLSFRMTGKYRPYILLSVLL